MTPRRARQAAITLISCMDRRDEAGAASLIERTGRGPGGEPDVDAVLWWVQVLESLRAARARSGPAPGTVVTGLLGEVYARQDAARAVNARLPRNPAAVAARRAEQNRSAA